MSRADINSVDCGPLLLYLLVRSSQHDLCLSVQSNAFAPAVPMLSEPSTPTNLGNVGSLGSFSASLEPVSPTRSNSSTSSPSRSNSGNVSTQLPTVSGIFGPWLFPFDFN